MNGEMMNGHMMSGGMMWMMGPIWLLVFVLLVLSIAALAKYGRHGMYMPGSHTATSLPGYLG